MNSETCPSEFVDLAGRLADAAGAVVRRYFRASVDVETKGDMSPVTIADKEAEKVMRELIEAECPEHGINGEEWGVRNGEADWCWYLDPIDGTKSFISGSHGFGTLIGLVHAGQPMLGIIDQPVLRERWLGYRGGRAELNGAPALSRACAELSSAILYTAGVSYMDTASEARFKRLQDACYVTRFSHDCYAAGLLASGHIDLMVEVNLQSHDIAGLVPVVEAAGGIVTDWQGEALNFGGPVETMLAAGDAAAHALALEQLRD